MRDDRKIIVQAVHIDDPNRSDDDIDLEISMGARSRRRSVSRTIFHLDTGEVDISFHGNLLKTDCEN